MSPVNYLFLKRRPAISLSESSLPAIDSDCPSLRYIVVSHRSLRWCALVCSFEGCEDFVDFYGFSNRSDDGSTGSVAAADADLVNDLVMTLVTGVE